MRSTIFEPKCTIETAGYFGESEGILAKIFEFLGGNARKIDKVGYNIRNFDWHENFIVRPCDVHLGADKWDIHSGQHKLNINFSKESLATCYAILTLDGLLFGNGSTVIYSDRYGIKQKMEGDCDVNSFVVTRDRRNVSWLSLDRKKINYLQSKFGYDYIQKSIKIPECFSRNRMRLYCNPHRMESRVFCFEGYPVADQSEESASLAIADLDSGRFAEICNLKGLQNIAISPDGHELTAITTKCFIRLNASNLEILGQRNIDQIRESELYVWPHFQYSPCGRYIAYNISKSGDIEIFEFRSLRRLAVLKTGGIPSSVFSWSCDGRFLASSVLPRSGGPAKLLLWDIDNFGLVAEIGPLKHGGSEMLYSNKPGFFAWHDHFNEFVVLKSDGDIVRYVQSAGV